MRILVVNPPILVRSRQSACEQDRLQNLQDLQRLGHEVRLVTRATEGISIEETTADYLAQGVQAHVISRKHQKLSLSRLMDFAFVDGSAWTFGSPDFIQAVEHEVINWKPDLIWVHATYAWPVLRIARKHKIPSVIRSVNYEAAHFWHEDKSVKRTLPNFVRYLGKQLGENHAVKWSSILVAITPKEQEIYQSLDRNALVEKLPLRALPTVLASSPVFHDRTPLNLYFMGANYRFSHNRAGLEFIIFEILPKLQEKFPQQFIVNILGAKPPDALLALQSDTLKFHGYVPDLDSFLTDMDIALMPSVYGTGMQQKVFESICRGIPTVTSPRALVGYAFDPDKHVLLAANADEFVQQVGRLLDPEFRLSIATNALEQAKYLFGRDAIDAATMAILAKSIR